MDSSLTTASSETLLADLHAALPAGSLLTSEADIAFGANDVYRTGGLPLAVARPQSVAGVQALVRLCSAAGVAIVPRGGGASYTDGYLHKPGGHVLIDTSGLDSINIDEANAVVTVGAGVTWARLKAELDQRGLRTPFWGPFSGIAATIGGSASQNTLSHGSSAHGISAQSILGMEVVLASGDILNTSAAEAMRFYGPDLTGLFTGDCGTLGIKVSLRLPLINLMPDAETLSFAFDDFAACHTAVRKAQLARLDDSYFGLDLALSQGQIGRHEGMGARLRIAIEVLKKAPNKLKGLMQVLNMALAGENPMRSGAYMCHFIVEGFDPKDAAHKAQHLRQIISPHGREIANSIPTFVRSMPFAPLTNILGPSGERWVPLHGVLSHQQVLPFHEAFQRLIASWQARMDKHGIWIGTMFSPVGSSGFLYEVALYWPDARTPYHLTVLGPEQIAKLPDYPANPAARAATDELKTEIVALMQDHGAGHFQIGRAYPYQTRLSQPARELLGAMKRQLDPQGIMNPGALGF
ncbi:FAD-binding oxidoreductase [Novosphingobium sp.]|uniref:FAD-binding oxidoreductase n=1 Tax=Novosphingobium sp. TaxID=1874826 RepID=UPI0031DCA4B7